MKNKATIYPICMLVLGIGLILFTTIQEADAFWSGMGSALVAVGIVRLLRNHRLRKNEAYREKMELEINDERHQFIRLRAWAWAGYLFIVIAGLAVILFRLLGQNLLSLAASWAVILMISLFWIAHLVLRKKY